LLVVAGFLVITQLGGRESEDGGAEACQIAVPLDAESD